MNRAQKIAWCFVIIISLAFIISLIAISLLQAKYGMPKALLGFSFMGIAGLAGVAPLFIKKDKGQVKFDERDKQINIRAAWAGFASSYLVFGLACMIPFSVLGPKATISVNWLPYIFGTGGLVMFFVHSVAILIQYGKGGRCSGSEMAESSK